MDKNSNVKEMENELFYGMNSNLQFFARFCCLNDIRFVSRRLCVHMSKHCANQFDFVDFCEIK